MPAEVLTTISPSTNKPVLARYGLSDHELALLPQRASEAFNAYRSVSLKQRQAIVKKALQSLLDKQDVLARELTEQMGRPIAYAAKEITTAVLRGEYLLKISEDALKDTPGEPEKGFKRYIRKVPVGPVLVLFAWNVRTGLRWELSAIVEADKTSVVPLPHPRKLLDTRFARRQFSYPKALASNSYYCRTYTRHFRRSWPTGECHSVFPLRLTSSARNHSKSATNTSYLLHRLSRRGSVSTASCR